MNYKHEETKEKKQIPILVTFDTYDEMKRLAAKDGRTVSGWVRNIVMQYMGSLKE